MSVAQETGKMPLAAETEAASILGYMSLAQLQEFAFEEGYYETELLAKRFVARFFAGVLRLESLPDRDTEGLSRSVDSNDESFGHPKLINLDKLQQMTRSDDLTRPYEWPPYSGELRPTRIGKVSIALAIDYISQRSRFLHGQQG